MAPRLLDLPPAYCSACHRQETDKRHVDFQAANDQGYGDDPNNKVPFDWLFICEDCLRSGAELIGMVRASDQERELTALRVEGDSLRRERDQAQRYVATLESAFDARPEKIKVDHRKKPRILHPQEA